ncbi:winged helix-turn-helix transcriptional regulator [Streptomyces sp. NPDC054796]
MKRTSFAQWPCSIARTMDLLGDWWTPLVLREAFYGVRRFDEFQQSLGIARTTLAGRLRRLVDEGLLEKQLYQEEPARYDYVLTEMGRDFFGVLAAMSRWGDRWLGDGEGPPVVLHHDRCGQESHAEVTCAACGEAMTAENTRPRLGPGFPSKLAQRPDIQERFTR